VKDIQAVRRENFQKIVKELGGPRLAGARLDISENQISQLISDNVRKVMGHRLARKIEESAGLPAGWLDQPVAQDGSRLLYVPLVDFNEPVDPEDIGKLGDKYIVWDFSNQHKIKGRLVAGEACDNSMEPLFSQGDMMVLDVYKGRYAVGRVVACLRKEKGGRYLCVRKLVEPTTGKQILTPLNSDFAQIPVSEDTATVVGELVEVRHKIPKALSS